MLDNCCYSRRPAPVNGVNGDQTPETDWHHVGKTGLRGAGLAFGSSQTSRADSAPETTKMPLRGPAPDGEGYYVFDSRREAWSYRQQGLDVFLTGLFPGQ